MKFIVEIICYFKAFQLARNTYFAFNAVNIDTWSQTNSKRRQTDEKWADL